MDPTLAWAYLQAHLKEKKISYEAAASAFAQAAFEDAEDEPEKATAWLSIAQALHDLSPQLATAAQIAHAQARSYLQQGQLASAEQALRQAQSIWQTVGDSSAVARTYLGLTQILALQGKHTEAKVASDAAVTALDTTLASTPENTPLLITALRNQANLEGYLQHHHQALAIYDRALQLLTHYRTTHQLTDEDVEIIRKLDDEAAFIAVNRAVDLMALARLQEAKEALLGAITYFSAAGNRLHGSRAQSNLASLYAQTGQYTEALATFEEAIQLLWGVEIQLDSLPVEELYRADVLLLDHAMALLALNLQQEAHHTLILAERLFTHAAQPYELGQTLYAHGLLLIKEQDWEAATTSLLQAATIFTDLHTPYWHNRTLIANAILLQQEGKSSDALTLLAPLLKGDPLHVEEQWYGWDLSTATELFLLQGQLLLQMDEPEAARRSVAIVAQLFSRHFVDSALETGPNALAANPTTSVEERISLGVPHLRFAYLYTLGRIEQQCGDLSAACGYFEQAVTLLETARASLPLEEIRIAFLADKITIYTDWMLALVDDPDAAKDEIAAAFAVVERARSRALLERLLVTLSDIPIDELAMEPLSRPGVEAPSASRADLVNQRNLARQQLHWLYNQQLNQGGARRLQTEELQTIRQLEFRLAQLERSYRLPIAATPIELHTVQAILQPDELVLAYYIAGEEIVLFAITATEIQLFRQLCSLATLRKAQRDLQFQMGRASSDTMFLHDLDARGQRLLQQALHQLYNLLLAPLATLLPGKQLKIIPHGLLNQIPFHALWTGKQYLIEEVDCCYVPSATIAVHQAKRVSHKSPWQRWSGLAVTEQGIPETEREVTLAAHFFSHPQLYLGNEASRAGLAKAAQEADILHISTHGLMRADNPLFSSLKLADGWIDVREIYRLDVQATLVVLSACRSGFSQIEQGDELMGLVRGFLGAGAHRLLVSQWDVDDAYAPHFMQTFYQHLTADALSPVAALRATQRHAIATGHHPYWWAPFFVIG